MATHLFNWSKQSIRKQLSVIRGDAAPSMILKNATYLSSARKSWLQGHIWIYEDRIVYTGEKLPEKTDGTEVVDCRGKYVVPGYIEPHSHPFQLYNPHSLAKYASSRGTTTLINDNLMFFLNMDNKKALTMAERLNDLPSSMYWWARYDAQTELEEEDELFSPSDLREWLEHPLVVQGGELTAWPQVMSGDDTTLHWMQYTKELKKPIEGHFPGASERTLTQMALLGVTADHEAMNGEEALRRLDAGMTTSLRYSSIRPDLPKILEELLEHGINDFSRFILNTDGSTPSFYRQGMADKMIAIALDKGVPDIAAYEMASYNVARHYGMDDQLGMIAPGRIAHLNILTSPKNPVPDGVLAKGQWVFRNGESTYPDLPFSWGEYGVNSLNIDWDLKEEDMHFSMPVGIELTNSVILKPYQIGVDVTNDILSESHNECFFVMLDRHGNWRINTVIKGFGRNIGGLASTFSNSGDIIIIGTEKNDMWKAFQELKTHGGGMFLVDNNETVAGIPLPLFGTMSEKPMEELMEEHEHFVNALRERGYEHEDPVYSMLFFSSTHLPYVRVTQQGIFDVHKKSVLFPAVMR
ncbi:adenine deaminase C-terminal domain-containing protein [Alteribacillus iranensis]|uniref:adenine deaminase n=1 Tax=Alteribacillus iranensis TaxID=930128 RepID=A0A1I2E7A9_9BACI|nr:adenine deaminase C-terminal domain-containing protein [Alteribacillus iranensis]SFE88854.1 Adenine deaminase [Alteribacillus iranensis]